MTSLKGRFTFSFPPSTVRPSFASKGKSMTHTAKKFSTLAIAWLAGGILGHISMKLSIPQEVYIYGFITTVLIYGLSEHKFSHTQRNHIRFLLASFGILFLVCGSILSLYKEAYLTTVGVLIPTLLISIIIFAIETKPREGNITQA